MKTNSRGPQVRWRPYGNSNPLKQFEAVYDSSELIKGTTMGNIWPKAKSTDIDTVRSFPPANDGGHSFTPNTP